MIIFRIRYSVQVHPATSSSLARACIPGRRRCASARRPIAEAARADRDGVLVDVRGINGRVPTILDRFELGTHIAKNYLESEPRIRLAILGHEPMIHPERFGELVARNRGADARVFTDEAAARDWLLARRAAR